jgi:hypothetical protein
VKNAENKKAEEMMPIVMVTKEKKKKKLDLDLLQKRTEDHPKARIEIGEKRFFLLFVHFFLLSFDHKFGIFFFIV